MKFHECKSNKIKGNQNNNKILIFFLIRPEIVKKFQIVISLVLVDQKYPPGDQIQGLDASYPMDPIGLCF